ncbi:hypothetical protein QTN25_010184 [Entamoeba marina]
MKFVNKNFVSIDNNTFIKDLSEVVHDYALTAQKQFRNDMKNRSTTSKTTDAVIETTINRRLINHNKRTLISDYNKFRDCLHSPIEDNTTLYLTNNKNEFNTNFDKIPYVKPNRITGNLVWCQVDPCVIARKAIKQGAMTLPTVNKTYSSGRAMTVLEHEYGTIYPARFTQIGDSSEVYWCVTDTLEDV